MDHEDVDPSKEPLTEKQIDDVLAGHPHPDLKRRDVEVELSVFRVDSEEVKKIVADVNDLEIPPKAIGPKEEDFPTPASGGIGEAFTRQLTDEELLKRVEVQIGELPETADPYVAELLHRMADLYKERNAVYKDNYKKVGAVMAAMFPQGKFLLSPDDYNKWHLFELAIVKLTRYANQYENGHADSLEDMIVYLAMVASIDAERENEDDRIPF